MVLPVFTSAETDSAAICTLSLRCSSSNDDNEDNDNENENENDFPPHLSQQDVMIRLLIDSITRMNYCSSLTHTTGTPSNPDFVRAVAVGIYHCGVSGPESFANLISADSSVYSSGATDCNLLASNLLGDPTTLSLLLASGGSMAEKTRKSLFAAVIRSHASHGRKGLVWEGAGLTKAKMLLSRVFLSETGHSKIKNIVGDGWFGRGSSDSGEEELFVSLVVSEEGVDGVRVLVDFLGKFLKGKSTSKSKSFGARVIALLNAIFASNSSSNSNSSSDAVALTSVYDFIFHNSGCCDIESIEEIPNETMAGTLLVLLSLSEGGCGDAELVDFAVSVILTTLSDGENENENENSAPSISLTATAMELDKIEEDRMNIQLEKLAVVAIAVEIIGCHKPESEEEDLMSVIYCVAAFEVGKGKEGKDSRVTDVKKDCLGRLLDMAEERVEGEGEGVDLAVLRCVLENDTEDKEGDVGDVKDMKRALRFNNVSIQC